MTVEKDEPIQVHAPGAFAGAVQWYAERTALSHAAFFFPHLKAGMRVLDCGCGAGTITLGLAEAVVPGEVIGIDLDDEQVARAKANASGAGPNISFMKGNIYQLDFDDASFDAVFAHGVLQHLTAPAQALQEVLRVLKPGGVFGARDRDLDGDLTGSPSQGHRDLWALFAQVMKGRFDLHFGRRLRPLLREAGFDPIESSASFESYGTPDRLRHFSKVWTDTWDKLGCTEQAVRLGLADADTMAGYAEAWRRWVEHPDAWYAMCRIEAIAWKPS